MIESLHGALRIVELLLLGIAVLFVLRFGPSIARGVAIFGLRNMIRGAIRAASREGRAEAARMEQAYLGHLLAKAYSNLSADERATLKAVVSKPMWSTDDKTTFTKIGRKALDNLSREEEDRFRSLVAGKGDQVMTQLTLSALEEEPWSDQEGATKERAKATSVKQPATSGEDPQHQATADSTEEEKLILTCTNCGAKNRLAASRRSEAVCGRCHTSLVAEVDQSASEGQQRVDAIRTLLAEGRSLRDVANSLGVTIATVDEVAREIAQDSRSQDA